MELLRRIFIHQIIISNKNDDNIIIYNYYQLINFILILFEHC
jgi:hypothetical protein